MGFFEKSKKHKTSKAIRILILTPLATTALCLLLVFSYAFILLIDQAYGLNPDIYSFLFLVFEIIVAFTLTAGLLMAIAGFVSAIIKKKPFYIALGSVLIVFLLAIDAWLYWALFVNEAGTKGPPVETTIQQTETDV